MEGQRATQYSEVVIHSAQVGVGDLSPGKKLQSHPRQAGSPEPRKTTCFTRSKGSQQQRKGSSGKEKERQPLSPPSTLLSGRSQTIAQSHWEALGRPHRGEGASQIKNNSLPVRGNAVKRKKRNATAGSRSKGSEHRRSGSQTHKSTSVPLTATPGRVPGLHNLNAAQSDVVWKLTWLFFSPLFYILIKVFSLDLECLQAGWAPQRPFTPPALPWPQAPSCRVPRD